jgi:hypothetical protein
MQVAQYTFQSPSTSQVQVGRLDPSSVNKSSNNNSLPKSVLNQTATKAESFAKTQTQAVKPTVEGSTLNLYV